MNFGVNENLNKMDTQSELNTQQYIPKKTSTNVKERNSETDSDLTIILVLSTLSGQSV